MATLPNYLPVHVGDVWGELCMVLQVVPNLTNPQRNQILLRTHDGAPPPAPMLAA